MKGTKVAGTIQALFEGKSKMYVECVSVDYKSGRDEVFHDLSMNVKGMNDLLASFENYVAAEMLDGENKYRTDVSSAVHPPTNPSTG